ncbi:MAG: hypothetical protein AAFZ65_13875, partial [Planctomycetota bacterium]
NGLAELSVVAHGDGVPIAGLVYVLHRSGTRGFVADAGRTGERGEIAVDRLEPGAWTLQTEASGPWAAHLAQFELEPGDQAQGRIELSRGASVSGRCVDELGMPIAGVEVIAPRFADGASLWPEQERDFGRVAPILAAGEVDGDPISKATSGPDGRFEARGLAGGEARLLLQAPAGHATPNGVPVVAEVADGNVVDVGDVVLRSPAVVVGAVLAKGEPLVGARVVVEVPLDASSAYSRPHWHRDSLVRYEAVTDAAGEFELEVGGGCLERPVARVSDRFEQRWAGQLPTLRPGERVDDFVIDVEPRTPIRIQLRTSDGSPCPRVSTTSADLHAAQDLGPGHPPVLLDFQRQLAVCPTASLLVFVKYNLPDRVLSTPYFLGTDGLLEGQVCTPPDRPLEVTFVTTEHEPAELTLTPDGLGALVGQLTLVPLPRRALRFVAAEPLPRRWLTLSIESEQVCTVELDTNRLPHRVDLRGGTGRLTVRDPFDRVLVSSAGFPVGGELEVPLTYAPPPSNGGWGAGGSSVAPVEPVGGSLSLALEASDGVSDGRRGFLRLLSASTGEPRHRPHPIGMGETATLTHVTTLDERLELVIDVAGLKTRSLVIEPFFEGEARDLGTLRVDPLPTFQVRVRSNNAVRVVEVGLRVEGSLAYGWADPWEVPLHEDLELPIPDVEGPLRLFIVGERGLLRGRQWVDMPRPRPNSTHYVDLEAWQEVRLEARSGERVHGSQLVPTERDPLPGRMRALPSLPLGGMEADLGYTRLEFLCTAGEYRLLPPVVGAPPTVTVLDRPLPQTITLE